MVKVFVASTHKHTHLKKNNKTTSVLMEVHVGMFKLMKFRNPVRDEN